MEGLKALAVLSHSTCVSVIDPLRAASRVREACTRSLGKSKNTFSLFSETTLFSRIKRGTGGCGSTSLVTDVPPHQESGRGEGTGKSEDLWIPQLFQHHGNEQRPSKCMS